MPPRDNTYWTLPAARSKDTKDRLRSQLEKIGCNPNASVSRPGLVALLQHHQLGYICCDNCTDNELKTFATDRHLATGKAQLARARLVSLLLKADLNPSFKRFYDLPPELRNRVYDLYITDLTKYPLRNPVDPPLTRVSRLLRSEVLSGFYNSCAFQIGIHVKLLSLAGIDDDCKRFFSALSDQKLCHIRKLEITTRLFEIVSLSDLARVKVEFSPGMDAYSLDYNVRESNDCILNTATADVKEKLKGMFDKVVGRKEAPKLRASDLGDLDSVEVGPGLALKSCMES